jgi:hypothetical protein
MIEPKLTIEDARQAFARLLEIVPKDHTSAAAQERLHELIVSLNATRMRLEDLPRPSSGPRAGARTRGGRR